MPAQFVATSQGLPGLKVRFKGINAAITAAFGKGKIEDFLLKRTRGRFLPKGRYPTAQKSPDGSPWAPLTQATLDRKKSGGFPANASRALYHTGSLAASIRILRKTGKPYSSGTTDSWQFSLGVGKESPAYKYAAVHQKGSGRVPARPFIGVGRGEEKVIRIFVQQIIARGVRG